MKRSIFLLLLTGCATQQPDKLFYRAGPQGVETLCFTASSGTVSFAERAEFSDPNTWTRFADDLEGTNICIPAGPPGLFRAGSRWAH